MHAPRKKRVTRRDFGSMKRILVKVGTGVVTDDAGFIALGRIGNLVEQITWLMSQGKEVILVTSGSVAMGRQKLDRPPLRFTDEGANGGVPFRACNNPRAYAAAGQSALMALYETMFRAKDICCSQVLVTDEDFQSSERRQNLRYTLNHLLHLRAVPIINENDVISTRKEPLTDENKLIFWDNDSLAALIAAEMAVELLILMSDVEGLCARPPLPGQPPRVIHTYVPGQVEFVIGSTSRVGRGGMMAKIEAAKSAVARGVGAAVIASGYKPHTIRELLAGERVGTSFTECGEDSLEDARAQAKACREASRALLRLASEERAAAIAEMARSLVAEREAILAANASDVAEAERGGLKASLLARLKLTPAKLAVLAEGLGQIAAAPEPIGKELRRMELAEGLVLRQETAPIGVLLVIFESRPDVLPQVAALAVRSGNGLVLKGGKEAARTNRALHAIVVDAVHRATRAKVPRECVVMVESRQEIKDLLKLTDEIDLVIPRGSAELVHSIMQATKIPVLGHSEGVCHVYVDKAADVEKAMRIAIDSKAQYPAACNAAETLLVHDALLADGRCRSLIERLRAHSVELYGGPRAVEALRLPPAESLKVEYGDMMMTVELVGSVEEAVAHINAHGSGHTDAVVTEDAAVARLFMQEADSACVFHNASTRFADGYRLGLGGEVAINTGKIHARGPVGIEGLQTTKWLLYSESEKGHVVADFVEGKERFVHRPMANL